MFCDDLARLFQGLAQDFGQTHFILGGGLADIGDAHAPILHLTQAKLRDTGITIEKAKLGNKAGMVGAKILAQQTEIQRQLAEAKPVIFG